MTLPEGVQPSGPTQDEPAVVEEATSAFPDETVEEETPEEAASDAALRAWARDNGIEGVPASGKLSAAWRDQITAAIAEAATEEPAEEEAAQEDDFPQEDEDQAEVEAAFDSGEKVLTTPPAPVQPEFEQVEYRSVFKAPNTWVSSQTFTS